MVCLPWPKNATMTHVTEQCRLPKFKMLGFLQHIALEAGELVKKYYYKPNILIENKGEKDLVTEADKACETFLLKKIKEQYPEHGFLGEEGIGNDPGKQYVWIIDPIDGTSNFAHHLPIFGISIALEYEGEITHGVVYNPISGEFFYAEKGKGAYLQIIGANGLKTDPKKLAVSKISNLIKGLVATGFNPSKSETMERNMEYFRRMLHSAHAVRRLGAASIDLAYVAAGYFEAYWEFSLKPWDVAAGILLVTEAGGTVSKIDGQPYSYYTDDNLLATNTELHPAMISDFKFKMP